MIFLEKAKIYDFAFIEAHAMIPLIASRWKM